MACFLQFLVASRAATRGAPVLSQPETQQDGGNNAACRQAECIDHWGHQTWPLQAPMDLWGAHGRRWLRGQGGGAMTPATCAIHVSGLLLEKPWTVGQRAKSSPQFCFYMPGQKCWKLPRPWLGSSRGIMNGAGPWVGRGPMFSNCFVVRKGFCALKRAIYGDVLEYCAQYG